MIKKILCLLLLATAFIACSSDDDAYNADAAQSNYKPAQGVARVSSVHTTSFVGGYNYSWLHNFSYDAQGRIKEINSTIKHYEYRTSDITDVSVVRECNISSNAKYFYNGTDIRIEYTITKEYPALPSWNKTEKYTDNGKLNGDGYISFYSAAYPSVGVLAFDCSYNMATLKDVNFDSGVRYGILRDSKSNVIGHTFVGIDREGKDSTSVRDGRYRYTGIKNKTNFDFSAYFGYWEHERYIGAMSSWPYASYQLAALGFFGATSPELPLWESGDDNSGKPASPWVIENGLPVKYTDPMGRVTVITY